MPRKNSPRSENLRRAVAQEAARIMAEHGIQDFRAAKRKAAERFGIGEEGALPSNTEIEASLAAYQRLFAADTHGATLKAQRHAALRAMRSFSHDVGEHRLRLDAERFQNFPSVRFELDEHTIQATVFPVDGIRQTPVSPVDGRPMRRADINEVEALLSPAAAELA